MERALRLLRSTGVRWTLLGLLALLVLSACAAGPNVSTDAPGTDGHTAGFWTGLWHGFIIPITFIVSLFTDSVNIYEVHNTGGWYDAGFLIGASSVFGGGGVGAKRRKS